ncbi:Acg family FMN-binding oxidoreductase [Shimia abyssi]|uniref:Nitroreductase family protein n=1 Tax=Shimia abyssi TaxID=1662395 RepID=A0A2P8FBG8_9RHOB|nr:twin-arginine translocation pathway signal protein [Shimia abyssi]PSL19059.1 hypothetical protein CLV88_1072 [Shimia abyssi]
MSLSRRKAIGLIGGGVVLAATSATALAVTRKPRTAALPWATAGHENEIRRQALSFALLAPNPHNRQPWVVDLSEPDTVVLYADPDRLLPATDPFSRQIVIGLGCFLEVMRMAAAEQGYSVSMDPFPEGETAAALDNRPVARARFVPAPSAAPDPLFAHVLRRRSLKEPFDTANAIPDDTLPVLKSSIRAGTRFGGSIAPEDIATLRELSRDALRIEIETPHTYKESVDLFRIGHREVDANPDGIDFSGPMFESLRMAGLFTRDAVLDTSSVAYRSGLDAVFANTDTAMGHVWLTSKGNSRTDQLAAGADWVRLNLAATGLGLGIQPLSQALQEYPEMKSHYDAIHTRLAPNGGTVQMFARIGYGPDVAPSPRWPLDTRIAAS